MRATDATAARMALVCRGFVYGVLVVVAVAVVVVGAVDNDVVRQQQLERRKSVFDEGKFLTENLKIVFVVKIRKSEINFNKKKNQKK